MAHRQGEKDAVHFRSDRVFAVNNYWFVEIRERDKPLGPYKSKTEAQHLLRAFLRELQKSGSATRALAGLHVINDPYDTDSY